MRSRRRRGFTLLEVLAAVAIMGILYTVLATVAARGVRSEGVNKRGLHAAQIADKALSDLEIQLISGQVPERVTSESEEGDYRVKIEVLAFDAYAEDQPARPAPLQSNQPQAEAPTNTLELVALEAPVLRDLLSTLRVTVSWQEGIDELSVVRSSFGLDLPGALESFPIPAPKGGEAGPNNSGFDEDVTQEDLEAFSEGLEEER